MSIPMLTFGQAAARAGVPVWTLLRLDRAGRLTTVGRTATGRRWYAKADIYAFSGISPEQKLPDAGPSVYGRASNAAGISDLPERRRVLGESCAARGLVDAIWVEGVGGGADSGRPEILDLMNRVERSVASHPVVAHRHWLTRFGFPWFEHFRARHGCQGLVADDERLAPEREMVGRLDGDCALLLRSPLRVEGSREAPQAVPCVAQRIRRVVKLGRPIAMELTVAQSRHMRRAAGTARFAWNWALADHRAMSDTARWARRGAAHGGTALELRGDEVRGNEGP